MPSSRDGALAQRPNPRASGMLWNWRSRGGGGLPLGGAVNDRSTCGAWNLGWVAD
jgi:hypothetical protein